MAFIPFELERWQSRWEHRVKFNLSESGVDPLSTAELLALDNRDAGQMLDIGLGYAQGNGSDELRDGIARLYEGATRENVMVTTGSAEANFLVCWALLKPGDEVAILMPTYMQTWGLAQNLGATIKEIPLLPENGWEPDPVDVRRAIGPKTKLVIITNPNNPTGHVLSAVALTLLTDCAREHGAWVLADEVYQGAELNGQTTPTMWGSYEKILVSGSLSKAYGLPGLRIGWVTGDRQFVEGLWARNDYVAICPTTSGDYLAQIAINRRDEILVRTRGILNTNYAIVEDWLRNNNLLGWTPAEAGAICLTSYEGGPEPAELAEALRRDYEMLIVPGHQFGLGRYIRIGIGNPTAELQKALQVLEVGLKSLLK